MEKKINIAELLKDCPKGMELDCIMYEGVCLVEVTSNANYPIVIKTKSGFGTKLTKYGQHVTIDDAKCIIFPKGKTTWEGFVPPCKFKDGDIISDSLGTCIFKGESEVEGCANYYCGISNGHFRVKNDKYNPRGHYGIIVNYRLATEEEKQKLFDAIKANGYKWNAETKTLEKLVQSKFDITTLVPFESSALARDSKEHKWVPAIWGYYDNTDTDFPYKTIGSMFKYCIPYNDDTKHLLCKTDDCDEYYKTWE